MTALLDEPRIAYVSRKLGRLRDDIKEWSGERGVLEDLVRDANRNAQDLFAFGWENAEMRAPSFPTNRWAELFRKHAEAIGQWASTAKDILDAVTAARQQTGGVPGQDELRLHLEEAKTITTADPTERMFRELARVWKTDTLYLSSPPAMAKHWAYQQIIDLGPPVVPLLLRELRSKPDFWFAALRALTGANPVAPEDAGKVQAMADAWVKWGEANHLI